MIGLALVAYGLLVFCSCHVDTLRVTGTYRSDEFFRFLGKFGFQMTDQHNVNETQGFIFGNITAIAHQPNGSSTYYLGGLFINQVIFLGDGGKPEDVKHYI